MTDRFQRYMTISLGAHAVLAIVIFFRAVLVPDQPLDLRSAIRVDIVGLPEKMTEPAVLPEKAPEPVAPPAKTKPQPKPVAKPEPKPEAPVVPSKTSKKDLAKAQREALNAIKAANALDRIKSEVSKEKPSEKSGTVIKGNTVSAGNSLTGITRLEYDKYTDELRTRIHSQFVIPQWLSEGNYRAQVQVMIDERGYVIKKIMRVSSGHEIFDAKVFEAIESSSPLPPPPQRLQGVLATSGIIMSFPE